jgi:hypothetical protein
MPQILESERSFRLLRRIAARRAVRLEVRPVWPCTFTTQPWADAWLEDEEDGILTLRVGDRCLGVIRASGIDQPCLNTLLERLRQRPPGRRRKLTP